MSKILILCSRTPYPLISGAKLRMYHTARILSKCHTVDLLVIDEKQTSSTCVNELKTKFNSVYTFFFPKYKFYINSLVGIASQRPLQTYYYYFNDVQDWIDKNIYRYDIVYCNHIRTTEYIRNHSITKIVDLVDAISKNYRRSYRYSNILKKPLYWLEKRRVLQYERQIITEFDHSFIVSESDKKFICSKTSEADDFSVLPNGVRSEYIEEADNMNYTSDNLYLVFLGKMDYYPNIDAVKYFSKHIFPNIQKNYPRISFDIVGGSPSSDIKMLDRYSQINVTGFVDDPRKYIERGTIFVAPMRTGAGVQNKILEAMALKKPVVTTSIGLEGIKAENKKHILVADSEEEFSDAINYLLLNPDSRARIGRKARELIKKRYTWESVEDHILGITNQLLTSMNHK